MLIGRKLPLRRVVLEGDDARIWLNGQVTCNLSVPAEVPSARYGLLLSPKAEIITDLWIFDDTRELSIGVHETRLDVAMARLERFLVMEDVDLEVSDEVLFSVQHTCEGELDLGNFASAGSAFLSPRLGHEGADLWAQSEAEVQALLTEVCDVFGEESFAPWEQARIEAGIADFDEDLKGESLLPQEAGLKHAVSFEKGCYIGQEPVVMLEHRGKPRRKLVRVITDAPKGTEITFGERVVGVVKSRVPDGDTLDTQNSNALAIIKFKYLERELGAGKFNLRVAAAKS